MVASMERARAALDALTQEEHGVDGRSICIYGEAWDFGEVACNQRGRNACQLNITGTGLGAGSANSLFFALHMSQVLHGNRRLAPSSPI
jgi:hypothetical protein